MFSLHPLRDKRRLRRPPRSMSLWHLGGRLIWRLSVVAPSQQQASGYVTRSALHRCARHRFAPCSQLSRGLTCGHRTRAISAKLGGAPLARRRSMVLDDSRKDRAESKGRSYLATGKILKRNRTHRCRRSAPCRKTKSSFSPSKRSFGRAFVLIGSHKACIAMPMHKNP